VAINDESNHDGPRPVTIILFIIFVGSLFFFGKRNDQGDDSRDAAKSAVIRTKQQTYREKLIAYIDGGEARHLDEAQGVIRASSKTVAPHYYQHLDHWACGEAVRRGRREEAAILSTRITDPDARQLCMRDIRQAGYRDAITRGDYKAAVRILPTLERSDWQHEYSCLPIHYRLLAIAAWAEFQMDIRAGTSSISESVSREGDVVTITIHGEDDLVETALEAQDIAVRMYRDQACCSSDDCARLAEETTKLIDHHVID